MPENYIFHSNTASLIKFEYFPILLHLLVAIVLSIVIILASYLLVCQYPESEKLSPYECGFEPYEDARNKFDVKFYLVGILFIIFDIEAVFLFPWTVVCLYSSYLSFWVVIDFIIELVIGYVYIWKKGCLDV